MKTAALPAQPAGNDFARDMVAGLVVFLVALPLCLGIALASGAPLLSGLISGVIGGIVVGMLSGSHVSVTGPAAGLAAVVLAQITSLGSFEAFLLAVLIAGGLQVAFGAFKAGFLANYFPTNVIKGLLAAIGVLLILKQVPHLVGYDKDYEGEMSFASATGGNTFSDLAEAARAFVPGALAVGVASLLILMAWDRIKFLKQSVVPGPLVAVVAGTLMSELMRSNGSAWTIDASHLVSVPVIGGEGFAWGDLLRMPDFSRAADPAIYLAAVTLAIVASLETLLNIAATDRLDPQRRRTPQNRELLAQGVGNMASGMVGGLPMTSVIIRSSVNVNAGSRTKRSVFFHGFLLLGSVALLPGLLNRIPLSALAAVLVVTGFKLASPKLVRSMWAEGKAQFIPFAVTVLAIVFTDLLVGVLIGLGTSLAFILWSNIDRGIRVIKEDHVGGLVHRIELPSQSTFLNRARLNLTLGEFRPGDHVLIDARTCDFIDPDILTTIHEYARETAPGRGVKLSLLGFQDRYALKDTVQYVDVSTREVQAALTPGKVLALLKEGNERFSSGRRLQRDLVRQVDATAAGQHPMDAVLSCIDSRAPAEILFDLGIGDIFSVRLAGNVASPKALGSLEFACRVAGAKLILVLGHTRCGAVKATCDFVARGVDPVKETGLTNLGSITQPISDAVHMERLTKDRRDASNPEFVDRVAAINVRNMMKWIVDNSPTLASMVANGEIAIVGAMYDVATGQVEYLDCASVAAQVAPPAVAAGARG
ncbi:MAG: bifunctional SulP family inorganic anion transporter/carbonic anhydrase [Phycisphaerales bacterium]